MGFPPWRAPEAASYGGDLVIVLAGGNYMMTIYARVPTVLDRMVIHIGVDGCNSEEVVDQYGCLAGLRSHADLQCVGEECWEEKWLS